MTDMFFHEVPSKKFLHECFAYDNGNLIWKARPIHHYDEEWKQKRAARQYARVVAGNLTSNGYIKVSINKQDYQAHRIIWKMFTGEDPTEDIDHIDGNRTNNKIENLQSVSHRENIWKGTRGGACQMSNGLWLARISHSFDNFEDAAELYKTVSKFAKEEYYRITSAHGGKKIPLPS